MPSSSTPDDSTIETAAGPGLVLVLCSRRIVSTMLSTIDRYDPSMTVLSSRPYITHLISLESSKLHCSQLPRLATEFGHPLVLLFLWPLRCCVGKTRVEFVPSPWTCRTSVVNSGHIFILHPTRQCLLIDRKSETTHLSITYYYISQSHYYLWTLGSFRPYSTPESVIGTSSTTLFHADGYGR